MTEQEVRAIVNDQINKQTYQAGAPKVYSHNHDGNNTPKVSGVNLINKPIYVYDAVYNKDTTTIITIGQNPSQILCLGVLESNTPGTFYVPFTGFAAIGNLLTNEAPLNANVVAPRNPTELKPTPAGSVLIGVTQCCNWFAYNRTTGGAFGSIDTSNLIFTTDSTSATLATGTLDKLFSNAIELKVVVPAGFTLGVVFIIS